MTRALDYKLVIQRSRIASSRSRGEIVVMVIRTWAIHVHDAALELGAASSRSRTRIGSASVLVFSLATVPLGCGGSHAGSAPPFEMGETTVVAEGDPARRHGEPIAIAIASPSKDERFKRGEDIEVRCSLIVPSGGVMPSKIYVELFDRQGRVVDTSEPVPKDDLGGGRYTLACSVRLPDRVGVYRLLATAIERVASIGANDSSSRLTTSKVLEVRAR